MNHTPGPWLRDGLTIYALHHNGDYDKGKPFMVNRFSAHVEPCVFQGGSMEEAEANARLIAASPDMKVALLAVHRLLEGAFLPGPIYLSIEEADAIRNAIAKTEAQS